MASHRDDPRFEQVCVFLPKALVNKVRALGLKRHQTGEDARLQAVWKDIVEYYFVHHK